MSQPKPGATAGAGAQGVKATSKARRWLANRDKQDALHLPGDPVFPYTSIEQRQSGYYTSPVAFRVEVKPDAVVLRVRVRIDADKSVSAAEVRRVKAQATEATEQIYKDRFTLTNEQQGKPLPLRVEVDYVRTGEDVRVKLHAGSGRTDVSNWHLNDHPLTFAHEISHVLGLPDEYVDHLVPGRATPEEHGVHLNDHSLMASDQSADAKLHHRHGKTLAELVSQATGETWHARVVPRQHPGL